MTTSPLQTDSPLSTLALEVLTLAVFEPGEWTATGFARDHDIKNHVANWNAQGCVARGLIHPPGWKVKHLEEWTEIRVLTLGTRIGSQVPGRVAALLNWLQTRDGYAASSQQAHAYLQEAGHLSEDVGVTATDRILRGLAQAKLLWPPRSWVATALGAKVLFELKPEFRERLDPLQGHIQPVREGSPDIGTRWVHLKGNTYTVVGHARLQVTGPHDNEEAVLYRGADGQMWCRPLSEFNRRFRPA